MLCTHPTYSQSVYIYLSTFSFPLLPLFVAEEGKERTFDRKVRACLLTNDCLCIAPSYIFAAWRWHVIVFRTNGAGRILYRIVSSTIFKNSFWAHPGIKKTDVSERSTIQYYHLLPTSVEQEQPKGSKKKQCRRRVPTTPIASSIVITSPKQECGMMENQVKKCVVINFCMRISLSVFISPTSMPESRGFSHKTQADSEP